jgi:SET and MYND domain-containing protein 4
MKSNKLASEFLVKGDKFLADEKLSEALESYNNCLRYAERDQLEASLAYGARAKVFYRLNLFVECKENIQLARNNNTMIDEVFDHDLRDIEDHFSSTIVDDNEGVNKWNFFKLTHEANHKIPFIAECLEIRQDDDYGRFIATTKDLNPGDMVIIEEPFYKVIGSTETQKRCSICLKQNSMNLLPCTSCSTGKLTNFKLFLKCVGESFLGHAFHSFFCMKQSISPKEIEH